MIDLKHFGGSMATSTGQRQLVKFGMFEVDLSAGEIRKAGMRLKLAPQPFRVLQVLLEHPQQVVSREELRERVWPNNTFVDYDLALKKAINRLRETLGDSADSPRFVETLPRRGYRFIAPIEYARVATDPPPEAEAEVISPRVSTYLVGSGPSAAPTKRVSARVWQAFATLAVVAIFAVLVRYRRIATHQSPPAVQSLAVLPLQNLSHDAEQEYFSDGMTDELITELAKVRKLRVISHSSVERYKETKRPIVEIAHELGVDAVVEGTVMRAGDRVRITAQLIDARTDNHLWAESYERDLRDVLGLQGEVARQIAIEIGTNLKTGEHAGVANNAVVDPDAHEDYLRGIFYWNRSDCDGFRKGLEYFQHSVSKDSHFAPPYVGIAQSYFTLADFGCLPSDDALPKSKTAAVRALELDPSLDAAHVWLGNLAFYFERDWPRAEQELTKAIEGNPNNPAAHVSYAVFLVAMGRRQQGFAEMKKAHELDPTSLTTNMCATFLLYLTRQFDQAIDQGNKTVDLHPDSPAAYVWLAPSYEMTGMYDQAIEAHLKSEGAWGTTPKELSTIRSSYEKYGMRGFWSYELEAAMTRGEDKIPDKTCWMAEVYAHLGERERTLEYLKRAVHSHCSGLSLINVDPLFDGMREDPAFKEIIARLRL